MKPINIVVTGASSGVGEAVTTRLATLGMNVFALSRHPGKATASVVPMKVDVTRPAQVKAAFGQIGRVDALINNAAVFEIKDFWKQSLETIERILDTNLKGTIYCTHAVLPGMVKRRSGRIVNIASVAGTRGIPQQAAYCASKHGVVGFSDALAQELLPRGITVCTLCPGGINTPLWRTKGTRYPGDLALTMSPDEVAELVEFILTRPAGTSYKKVVFFPNNEWH